MISVIVPVYNVKDYLARCVESIISQDYTDLEIILVDDGSTDGSGEICDELMEGDSRITVIHKENGGLSSARNIALDSMKGEYVFFVDSDDYIMPGILRKLHHACVTNNAEIACCGYISGKKKYYCNKKEEIVSSIEAAKKMFIYDGLDSNAVCKLYARYLFDKIRYPLCVYEVVPVTYKIILKANKIVNIYQAGYYIEKRSGSITRSPFGSNNLLYVTMAEEEYFVIRKQYEELASYAYTFYLNALISMREKAEESKKTEWTYEKQKIIELFNQNFRKIMMDKMLVKRKKCIALLIRIGLYHAVLKIYRFIGL